MSLRYIARDLISPSYSLRITIEYTDSMILQSQLPEELPPDFDHIRTIVTKGYTLIFSKKGSSTARAVDIRTSKGRLAILDWVFPTTSTLADVRLQRTKDECY